MKRLALILTLCFASLALVGLLTFYATPAVTAQEEVTTRLVRAYYPDPSYIAKVAAWNEPWELNTEQGYMVLELTQAEADYLVELGFRLEEGESLLAFYNNPNEMLPGQGGGIPGYPCYRTVEETYATAQSIVATYPNLATWTDIGDSWEKVALSGGYDLMVLRLTNSATSGPKPKLFIMASIHAREYTPAELVTRYAEYLVNNYGTNADVTWLLDYNEIHLLLQGNPDGRKQAETGLSWRKNTNQNYCGVTSTSRGVDLNRNYPYEWGEWGGSSGSACSTTYRGPIPVSDPETQAVVSYVTSQFPDQRLAPENDFTTPAFITTTGVFMDIHSSGQLVLWPWGFTNQPTGNGAQLQTLGRKFAFFNNSLPQQAIGLYPTDGTTDDFAYGELGLAAYTFELGSSFFQSCSYFENNLIPWNIPALVYAAKVAQAPYIIPVGPDALNVATSAMTVTGGTVVALTATINDTRYNNSNGTEPTQNVAAASYYFDTPPWITTTTPIPYPMSPADGNFNSPVEGATATIDTSSLALGRHTIFVRGQDANGNWGAVSAIFLDITDMATPQASFTSTSPDYLGQTTTFTDSSSGASLAYSWDFGDGSSSTDENPTHQYAAAGTYTVTLTVTNPAGNDTYTDTVEILINTISLPILLKP
jgi:PKD repeat protein